jgi:hypothetical protein
MERPRPSVTTNPLLAIGSVYGMDALPTIETN